MEPTPSKPPNRAGRLARRFIADLFSGDLYDDILESFGDIIPDWSCSKLQGLSPEQRPLKDHHDFITLPSQCYEQPPNSETPAKKVHSFLCRLCRHHLVLRVGSPSADQVEQHKNQHHLVRQGGGDLRKPDIEHNLKDRLYPLLWHISYHCSACELVLDLEISAPRMPREWIDFIADPHRIKSAIAAAKNEDPDRFKAIDEEKTKHYAATPLETLNTYLKDVLENSEKKRRIASRNKTFKIQFGQACEHVFRYLGFTTLQLEDEEDVFWLPPSLDPKESKEAKTLLGSERAFYEDVRTELSTFLEKPPGGLKLTVALTSPPGREALETALGLDSPSNLKPKPQDPDEIKAFRALGASWDSDDDETLKWAYQRQITVDPDNRSKYNDHLGRLAANRGESLQLYVILDRDPPAPRSTEPSTSQDLVERAYMHFQLDRNQSRTPRFVAHVIGIYRARRDATTVPDQLARYRENLLLIGNDLENREIKAVAYHEPVMQVSEACAFLAVKPEWPLDNIAAAVRSSMDVGALVSSHSMLVSHRGDQDH